MFSQYVFVNCAQLFSVEYAVWIGRILLRSGHTNAFLIDCEQSQHRYCTELSHAQMCMQNIDRTLSWEHTISAIPLTFTFGSFKTISWILLIISGVVTSFFYYIVTSRHSTASSNKQSNKHMKESRQHYCVRNFIDASYSQIYRSTEYSIWNYHVPL